MILSPSILVTTQARRRAALAAVLVGSAGLLALASCSSSTGPAPGAVMLSIDTNLKAPEDVDAIGVEIRLAADGGLVYTDEVFDISEQGGDAGAVFPATYAIVRGTDQPVAIKVVGYKNGAAITERDAITTLPPDRTAVLQMNIDWLDKNTAVATSSDTRESPPLPSTFSSTCQGAATSISGTCRGIAEVAADQALADGGLPTFVAAPSSQDPDECFDVDTCFGGFDMLAASGANQLDVPVTMAADGSCSFLAPTDTSNLNVGLRLAGGKDGWCNDHDTACVLPIASDPKTGWSLDGKGHVLLPAAVCTQKTRYLAVVATTQASGVDATGKPVSCHIKSAAIPACQSYGVPEDAGVPTGSTDATIPSDAQMDIPDGDVVDAADAAPDPKRYTYTGDSGIPIVGMTADDDHVYVLRSQGYFPDGGSDSLYLEVLDHAFHAPAGSYPYRLEGSSGNVASIAASYPYLAMTTGSTTVVYLTTPEVLAADGGSPYFATVAPTYCGTLVFATDGIKQRLVVAACGSMNSASWVDFEGGKTAVTAQGVISGEVTAVAFDPVAQMYANAAVDIDEDWSVGYGGFDEADASTPFDHAMPVAQSMGSSFRIQPASLALLGSHTLVAYVNDTSPPGNEWLVALRTDMDAGAVVPANAAFVAGNNAGNGTMVGLPSRLLWLANGDISTANVVDAGVVSPGAAGVLNVDASAPVVSMALSPKDNELFWFDHGTVYRQNASFFP